MYWDIRSTFIVYTREGPGERRSKMTKAQREQKNMILAAVRESMKDIFKASKESSPLIYESVYGRKYIECPEAYSADMTRAICSDINRASLIMLTVDKEHADILKNLSEILESKDLTIRRMYDDQNDNRPVTKYEFINSTDLIRRVSKLRDIFDTKESGLGAYREKLSVWVERILKMDKEAYYINARETLKLVLAECDSQVFDSDGNLIYGPTDDDAKCVRILINMTEILLKVFLRIPGTRKESNECLDRIETLLMLIKVVLNGDTDKLEYLAKCAEAAKEFEDLD